MHPHSHFIGSQIVQCHINPGLPNVPTDEDEGDHSGHPLQHKHHIAEVTVVGHIVLRLEGDVQTVHPVIQEWEEDEENLQKEQEGNVPQPLHLLTESVGSPGGVIVRQEMLDQKKSHRYDTQQRVQPTVEKTGVIHCQAPHKPECFSYGTLLSKKAAQTAAHPNNQNKTTHFGKGFHTVNTYIPIVLPPRGSVKKTSSVPFFLQETADRRTDLIKFNQECIVSVIGFNFFQSGPFPQPLQEGMDFSLFPDGKQNIFSDADDQHVGLDPRQRPLHGSPSPADIVQIHRLEQIQIAVRIEAPRQLFPVIPQVAFHLKQGIQTDDGTVVLNPAAESLLKQMARPISHHPHHP